VHNQNAILNGSAVFAQDHGTVSLYFATGHLSP